MLNVGDFVLYCIGGVLGRWEYRPALVVRVWTPTCAQLQVFPDKANDGADPFGCDWFRSSASCGEGLGFWIPRPGIFAFSSGTTFDGNGSIPTPYLQPTIGYPR